MDDSTPSTFIASVLSVFLLLPLALSKAHAHPCCARVFWLTSVVPCGCFVLLSSNSMSVSGCKCVRAVGQTMGVLSGKGSTLLRCNLKCFLYQNFVPRLFHHDSNMRCGESRVRPICQRCYSIKVYDRRLCRFHLCRGAHFHREYHSLSVSGMHDHSSFTLLL
jgi:hypothetical protein